MVPDEAILHCKVCGKRTLHVRPPAFPYGMFLLVLSILSGLGAIVGYGTGAGLFRALVLFLATLGFCVVFLWIPSVLSNVLQKRCTKCGSWRWLFGPTWKARGASGSFPGAASSAGVARDAGLATAQKSGLPVTTAQRTANGKGRPEGTRSPTVTWSLRWPPGWPVAGCQLPGGGTFGQS